MMARRLITLGAWLCLATLPAVDSASTASPVIGDVPAAVLSLAPIRTDSPRDTLKSFLNSMHTSLDMRDARKDPTPWIDDAVRCFHIPMGFGDETVQRMAAIHLKEVIDRVVVVDLTKVPDDRSLDRWRLRNTDIVIAKVDDGPRKGEYLFTPDTVSRAAGMFEKIREFPYLAGQRGGGWTDLWQRSYVPAWATRSVWGMEYWQWAFIVALVGVGWIMRGMVSACANILLMFTRRTSATWDDDLIHALTRPMTHLGTTGIWFMSMHLVGVSGTPYTIMSFIIKGAFFINVGYLAYAMAGFMGQRIGSHMTTINPDLNKGLIILVTRTLQVASCCFCILLGAQNMGIDVASLVAGLGIGGLAFALAAKDTLANVFGSIMIMIDRPFKVGDFIMAKGGEGTVEDIGFRSTRLRTPANSVLTIPNSELVMTNIDNMGMRPYRRVREMVGVTYDTAPSSINVFCIAITSMLQARSDVKPGGIDVALHAMNASSLDILVNYHIKASTWSDELRTRHEVITGIMDLAKDMNIAFAFPTQTIHIASTPTVPAS